MSRVKKRPHWVKTRCQITFLVCLTVCLQFARFIFFPTNRFLGRFQPTEIYPKAKRKSNKPQALIKTSHQAVSHHTVLVSSCQALPLLMDDLQAKQVHAGTNHKGNGWLQIKHNLSHLTQQPSALNQLYLIKDISPWQDLLQWISLLPHNKHTQFKSYSHFIWNILQVLLAKLSRFKHDKTVTKYESCCFEITQHQYTTYIIYIYIYIISRIVL